MIGHIIGALMYSMTAMLWTLTTACILLFEWLLMCAEVMVTLLFMFVFLACIALVLYVFVYAATQICEVLPCQ